MAKKPTVDSYNLGIECRKCLLLKGNGGKCLGRPFIKATPCLAFKEK